jgi:hypothetical protein
LSRIVYSRDLKITAMRALVSRRTHQRNRAEIPTESQTDGKIGQLTMGNDFFRNRAIPFAAKFLDRSMLTPKGLVSD